MAHSLTDLLKVTRKIDERIASQPPSTAKPQPLPKQPEPFIPDVNEDPFGSNVNNRKVAERIATQGGNTVTKVPTLDPQKAAEDVAKSKELNPPKPTDEDSYREVGTANPFATPLSWKPNA